MVFEATNLDELFVVMDHVGERFSLVRGLLVVVVSCFDPWWQRFDF
jgi:hypothetical protein